MFTNSPSLTPVSLMVCEKPSLTEMLSAIVDAGQTDRRTDRRFSPIHRPDLLCNSIKNCKLNGQIKRRRVIIIFVVPIRLLLIFLINFYLGQNFWTIRLLNYLVSILYLWKAFQMSSPWQYDLYSRIPYKRKFSRVSNFAILWSKVVSLFSRVQFFANLKIHQMLKPEIWLFKVV